jgi:BioD-like phosphotransacetylase family protein
MKMADKFIMDYIRGSNIPVLNVQQTTSQTMRAIENFTAKMTASDKGRTSLVVDHYEPYIDYDLLLGGSSTDDEPHLEYREAMS